MLENITAVKKFLKSNPSDLNLIDEYGTVMREERNNRRRGAAATADKLNRLVTLLRDEMESRARLAREQGQRTHCLAFVEVN